MGRVMVVAVAVLASSAGSARRGEGAEPMGSVEARGRYLVERVGMCQDCHTPRGEDGAFVEEERLAGAPIGFAPLAPMPAWAEMAPPVAGLPTMSSEQGVQFLMTGAKPDGSHPRPPMPEYRLDRPDAEAVVAYLKSLASSE